MTVQAHWLAFYADRFIKETSQLNPFEVATYYRFFESYAQTGYLVDDVYILADIAKLNSAMPVFKALTHNQPDRTEWSMFVDATIGGLLTRYFQLHPDGTYRHQGWDTELAKAAAKYEARVKGGRSRWGKATASGESEIDNKTENGNQTENQTDSDKDTQNQIDNKNRQQEQEQTTRTRTTTSEHHAEHVAELRSKGQDVVDREPVNTLSDPRRPSAVAPSRRPKSE